MPVTQRKIQTFVLILNVIRSTQVLTYQNTHLLYEVDVIKEEFDA